MKELLRKNAEKIRYLFVGGFNTLLDFALLFGLVALGLDKIPANYISTTIAMVISFFLNKDFTFKVEGKATRKQFALFLIVTAIGLWVIQPIVILISTAFLDGSGMNESVILFIAKVIATIASLIWNFLLYSKLVFKKVDS